MAAETVQSPRPRAPLDFPWDGLTLTRRAAGYLRAQYLCRLLGAVRGFINARWLGPEQYGFWGSLVLLVSFGYHLHGGVNEVMVRDIPRQRSLGQAEAARRSAQLAWSFLSLMLLAASAALWLVAWWLPPGTPAWIRGGWFVAGVALPFEVLFFFEQTVTRVEERFAPLNRSLLFANGASLALTCWLVIAYGLPGLFLVAVATPAIGLGCLRRHAAYPWRPTWSWDLLRAMLKAGWPILAMTLVFEALGWVDRALVLGCVGLTGYGYYSLGIMLAQFCYLFPEGLAAVVEPKLHFDFAKAPEARNVQRHVWFSLQTLALVMPMGLALAECLYPAAIRRWLPAYAPGLPAIRLLVWGSFFTGLMYCTKSFIVAVGEQRRALGFYGIAIAVHLLVSLWLLARGWGLTGVACGTVVATGLCSVGLLAFAFHRLGWRGASGACRLVRLYVPGLASGALVFGLPHAMATINPAIGPAALWLVQAGGVGLYGLVLLLMMWRQVIRPGRQATASGAELTLLGGLG